MRKLVLFMHTSLDGFVAGPNGEMDWIKVDEAIFEYASRCTHEADTALYGRVTYQMMEAYWPTAASQPGASRHDIDHSRWYNSVTKVVISKAMEGSGSANTKVISKNLGDEIRKLKQLPGKDILMFGSPTTAHALMTENLIDEFWLFVNPVLLGEGIPMFKHIQGRIKLDLAESNTFASGVVCLHYVNPTGK